jgi:hypothetical protein
MSDHDLTEVLRAQCQHDADTMRQARLGRRGLKRFMQKVAKRGHHMANRLRKIEALTAKGAA